MPGPSLVLGFILATLYGAAFHLVSGGDARRLALFLLVAWVGFALGQGIGKTASFILFDIADIGSLHMLPATLGAWLALVVARLLTRQPKRRSARQK